MYEKARKYWKLNVNKAQSADYVLAVYEGVVRAVFKPQRWYEVKEPRLFSGTRYAFDGVEVFDSPYLNMDVSEYIKGQSPVRYINFLKYMIWEKGIVMGMVYLLEIHSPTTP